MLTSLLMAMLCGGPEDIFARVSSSFSPPEYQHMGSMPVPICNPSTSPLLNLAHSPGLSVSPSAHSQASQTPPLMPIVPSPAMQQQNYELMRQEGATAGVDDAIVEKFDSFNLDVDVDLDVSDLNFTRNLSTSLFDSAPNITDTTYQQE